jgi:hypothetical protein
MMDTGPKSWFYLPKTRCEVPYRHTICHAFHWYHDLAGPVSQGACPWVPSLGRYVPGQHATGAGKATGLPLAQRCSGLSLRDGLPRWSTAPGPEASPRCAGGFKWARHQRSGRARRPTSPGPNGPARSGHESIRAQDSQGTNTTGPRAQRLTDSLAAPAPCQACQADSSTSERASFFRQGARRLRDTRYGWRLRQSQRTAKRPGTVGAWINPSNGQTGDEDSRLDAPSRPRPTLAGSLPDLVPCQPSLAGYPFPKRARLIPRLRPRQPCQMGS